jgi:hypothetical protein
MGINNTAFNAFNQVIENYKKNKHEICLLELGIQEATETLNFRYFRDLLKNEFKNYTSLDLHDIPGVTLFDLSKYQPTAFTADIITNFGTSEHIEYEQGQYNCWHNIHNWLNVGGIAIHEIPEKGSWKNHCRYYTTFEFFYTLEDFGYKIIELKNHSNHNGNLNWCVVEKIKNCDFMDYDTFYKVMHIDIDVPLSSVDPLNNPNKLI